MFLILVSDLHTPDVLTMCYYMPILYQSLQNNLCRTISNECIVMSHWAASVSEHCRCFGMRMNVVYLHAHYLDSVANFQTPDELTITCQFFICLCRTSSNECIVMSHWGPRVFGMPRDKCKGVRWDWLCKMAWYVTAAGGHAKSWSRTYACMLNVKCRNTFERWRA